jgi:hypothetical protein
MSNGPSQVAGSFVDALKGQPLSLALVAMNLALIGYLYYEGKSLNEERKAERELLYQNRREVAVLLARCKWPDNTPLPPGFDSGPGPK